MTWHSALTGACHTSAMDNLTPIIKALPLQHLPPPVAAFLMQPINFVAVFIALLVLLITLLLSLRKRDARNTFLLVGPRDAGKTALIFRVQVNRFVETYTSMKENVVSGVFPSETGASAVRFVDIPGHARVRAARLFEYLPTSRAIIFVVDASQFNVRQSAEVLFELLVNEVVQKRRLPVLVLLNKYDSAQPTATEDSIRTALEHELNQIRRTRKSLPTDEANQRTIGVDGEDFSFDRIPNRVTFGRSSARSGQLQDFQRFVRSFVK